MAQLRYLLRIEWMSKLSSLWRPQAVVLLSVTTHQNYSETRTFTHWADTSSTSLSCLFMPTYCTRSPWKSMLVMVGQADSQKCNHFQNLSYLTDTSSIYCRHAFLFLIQYLPAWKNMLVMVLGQADSQGWVPLSNLIQPG